MNRYFAIVRAASTDGSFVAERDDGVGRLFIPAREATTAGHLVVGDRVEVSIMPGEVAADILLVRHARQLAAQAAK